MQNASQPASVIVLDTIMPLNRLRLTVDQPFHSWCQSPFLSHRRFCELTNRFRPCCRCKFRQSIQLLLHRPSLSLRRFVHDMSFFLLPNPLAAPRGNGQIDCVLSVQVAHHKSPRLVCSCQLSVPICCGPKMHSTRSC